MSDQNPGGQPGPNDPWQAQPPASPPPPAAPGYPPAGGYSQAPGYPPAGGYAPTAAPVYDYASWGSRVASYLIDGLIVAVPSFILALVAGPEWTVDSETGSITSDQSPFGNVAFVVGTIALTLFGLWNVAWRQGKTGQSLGKSAVGTRTLKESTGEPLGVGMAFLRQLCHFFDQFLCGLGYLWPIWDQKRQTFADKIISSVVVRTK